MALKGHFYAKPNRLDFLIKLNLIKQLRFLVVIPFRNFFAQFFENHCRFFFAAEAES